MTYFGQYLAYSRRGGVSSIMNMSPTSATGTNIWTTVRRGGAYCILK